MNGKHKWLRISVVLCLVFTIIWLVLMIVSLLKTGPIDSFEKAVSLVKNPNVIFDLSYINAVFVTITTTMFFTSLYLYCKTRDPELSLMSFVFVPVYCIFNLFVYYSQVTILPRIVSQMNTSGFPEMYKIMLGQFIQVWPHSGVAIINGFAYGILGIPSIIFGNLLMKGRRLTAIGGLLLLLNGVACIVGSIGYVMNNEILTAGSVIGGVLYLLSLIVILMAICRNEM